MEHGGMSAYIKKIRIGRGVPELGFRGIRNYGK